MRAGRVGTRCPQRTARPRGPRIPTRCRSTSDWQRLWTSSVRGIGAPPTSSKTCHRRGRSRRAVTPPDTRSALWRRVPRYPGDARHRRSTSPPTSDRSALSPPPIRPDHGPIERTEFRPANPSHAGGRRRACWPSRHQRRLWLRSPTTQPLSPRSLRSSLRRESARPGRPPLLRVMSRPLRSTTIPPRRAHRNVGAGSPCGQ
jgi:hypothetical protein